MINTKQKQKKASKRIFNYFILRGRKQKNKKKTRKVIIDIEQDPIILKSAFKKKKKNRSNISTEQST